MNHLIQVLTAVTPSPSPKPQFDPNDVTPTVLGFVATLLFAVAVILLLLDMNRRIRRVRYRAEITEKLDAERDAANGADAAGASPASAPTSAPSSSEGNPPVAPNDPDRDIRS